MDILTKALGALWQVVAVGILLGAGLPALFALGVRSLNSHRVLVGTDGNAASTGTGTGAAPNKPTALGMTGAVVCFGILIIAVIFGIVAIVFGKQLFGN